MLENRQVSSLGIVAQLVSRSVYSTGKEEKLTIGGISKGFPKVFILITFCPARLGLEFRRIPIVIVLIHKDSDADRIVAIEKRVGIS
ncbi:Uncharacterised protein [Chlamydia trachomatis]|nr:Uncharacterised protein [Chlamydia trachomatis]